MTSDSKTSSFNPARFLRRHGLLPLIAGVLLAILAPFGTAVFDWPIRAAFWIGMTFAGGFGALIARMIMARWADDAGIAYVVFAMSIGATLAVSPFVLFVFSTQTAASIGLSLFYIWVISIAISAVGALSDRAQSASDTLAAPTRPALMDRLPPRLRDAMLYAITSEDHYVRVITDHGEHMHLMRLSDAEDLAHPIAGLKPHRSWWVAESGVEHVKRKDGKLTITLKNGDIVPVSRSGTKALRAANWV